MNDLQQEVVSILSNLLYYCDWVMLTDNGLTSPQMTSYTNLRTSMHSTVTNILTYNDAQLNTLLLPMFGCLSDMCNRPVDFTNNMTNLQNALTAL